MNCGFEAWIALSFLRLRKGEFFLSLISLISVGGVAVGVAALIVVLLGVARLIRNVGTVPLAKLERELRYRAVAGINAAAGVMPNLSAAYFSSWRRYG